MISDDAKFVLIHGMTKEQYKDEAYSRFKQYLNMYQNSKSEIDIKILKTAYENMRKMFKEVGIE